MFKCPVGGCKSRGTSRSADLFAHLRQKHPDTVLPDDVLDRLGGKYCDICHELMSISGKNHRPHCKAHAPPVQPALGVARPESQATQSAVPQAASPRRLRPRNRMQQTQHELQSAAGPSTYRAATAASSSGGIPLTALPAQPAPVLQPNLESQSQPRVDTELPITSAYAMHLQQAPMPQLAPNLRAIQHTNTRTPRAQPLPTLELDLLTQPDLQAHAEPPHANPSIAQPLPASALQPAPPNSQVAAHGAASPSLHRATPAQCVPQAARTDWAQSVALKLESVLDAVRRGSNEGITTAFAHLLALPGQVLADTGAARGRARRVRARLARANEGGALGMRYGSAASNSNTSSGPAPHRLAAKVHRYLQHGSITRAARLVDAPPIAQPTAEVRAALRALHPHEDLPNVPAITVAAPAITADILTEVLRALPRGSAAGPSGWTYEHIAAAVYGSGDALNAAIRLVNVIVRGDLPHLPALLDSTLIAQEKPGSNSGVRPIAIGETWVRLAGLCAMAASPGIGPALAPLQLGVGVRGGSQCMGHAIRAGIAADPGCVTVQLDWRNAFNTVSRGAMLKAVAQRAPGLLPFAAWLYKQPGRLWIAGAPPDDNLLLSERGVRQGDPCGPLFFALTLQGPLEQVNARNPDAGALAYADDCNLQGPPAAVPRSVRMLKELGGHIGLTAGLDKSCAYSEDTAAAAAVAAELDIAHKESGLMVVGTPVGTADFVAAHAHAAADAACASIDRLMDLPLPAQDKFILLRSSKQWRLAHLPRVVPWELVSAAVGRLQTRTASAAGTIAEHPLSDAKLATQLTLPLRHGGMGIVLTSAAEAQAAYLSAAAVADTAVHDGPARFRPFAGVLAAGLQQAWTDLRAAAPDSWTDAPAQTTADCIQKTLPGVQRVFSRVVADRRHAELLASCDPDSIHGQHDLARLRSCACGPASMWLDSLPVGPALQLSDADFVCAMRHRLGISQMPANAPAVQCFCKEYVQPGNVDHALTCNSLSGAITLRHDILTGIWRRIAGRAGVATSSEPELRPLRGRLDRSRNAGDRGDILLALQRALTVGDVSVIHPAAQTYARAAARTAGSAAAVRDRQKRARYDQAVNGSYAFVPLSVESYGRLGEPAMRLLNTLADSAAAGGVVVKGDFVRNALRELCFGLCRGNGIVYRAGFKMLARASGRAFLSGADVPFADVC